MFPTDPNVRTTLILPDRSELDWTPTTPGVRRFKRPDHPYPYGFDINGRRYRVDSINEFAFVPSRDGSDEGPWLILKLVEFGPPAN